MVNVTKVLDHSYIIVLDKDFKVNGLTDIYSQGMIYSAYNNYALDRNIVNSSVAVIIPDILLQMEYREDIGFYVPKEDSDLKGVLYTVSPHRALNEKVDRILERIKQTGKLMLNSNDISSNNINDGGAKQEIAFEYEELIKEIASKASNKHSVFYKIVTRVFNQGKFKYHRVYISNDLITMNENSNSHPSGNYSSQVQKAFMMNAKNPKQSRGPRTKDSKIVSSKQVMESHKQIKLRLNHTPQSGEEHQKILEEQQHDHHKELQKDAEKKLKEKEEEIDMDERSHFSSNNTKSAFSKSSVDSASFNKLKNGILEKKEVFAIKVMRYLSFAFGIGTIILVFFASQSSNTKFSRVNDYLSQNLYFNHSKISVSCVYASVLNLKIFKESNLQQFSLLHSLPNVLFEPSFNMHTRY